MYSPGDGFRAMFITIGAILKSFFKFLWDCFLVVAGADSKSPDRKEPDLIEDNQELRRAERDHRAAMQQMERALSDAEAAMDRSMADADARMARMSEGAQNVLIGYQAPSTDNRSVVIGYSAGVADRTANELLPTLAQAPTFPPAPLDIIVPKTTPLRPIPTVKPRKDGDETNSQRKQPDS